MHQSASGNAADEPARLLASDSAPSESRSKVRFWQSGFREWSRRFGFQFGTEHPRERTGRKSQGHTQQSKPHRKLKRDRHEHARQGDARKKDTDSTDCPANNRRRDAFVNQDIRSARRIRHCDFKARGRTRLIELKRHQPAKVRSRFEIRRKCHFGLLFPEVLHPYLSGQLGTFITPAPRANLTMKDEDAARVRGGDWNAVAAALGSTSRHEKTP